MSAPNRPWMRWILLSVSVAFLLAAGIGFMYEQIGRWQDHRHLFRIGRAVAIGGRTLNIDCEGQGAPAVILEPGGFGGYGGHDWGKVQPGVAKFTQVCWYDRAGEGWSDPSPAPRNSVTITEDLHELLQRAPIPRPYLIVGHSIGGSYARIFAARFPSEVAGVVLVDSSHPDQKEPSILLAPINRMPTFMRRVACYAEPLAARFGIIRFLMRNERVDVPPQFSSQESAATRALRGQIVKRLESEVAQGCAATQGGAVRPDGGSGNPEVDQAAREARSLGHIPLVVLTAGQYWKPPDPITAREVAQFHEVWVHQLQPDLARLSTEGKQVIVENSDHGIPGEAPGAVVRAIQDIVNEIRARH